MGSDEERLEEMLKAVMETEKESAAAQEKPMEETAKLPEEKLPEVPMKDLSELPMEEVPEATSEELPELPVEDFAELQSEELPELPMEDFAEPVSEELPELPIEDFAEATSEELPELPIEDFAEASSEELPELPMEDFAEATSEELPELPMEDFAEALSEELPELPTEDFAEELPEIPAEDFSDEPMNEMADSGKESVPEASADDVSKQPAEEPQESQKDEMAVDPLKLLAMSEEEIDKVLEEEAALGEKFSGKRGPGEISDQTVDNDDLADIEKLLQMSDNHEQVDGGERVQSDVSGDSMDSEGDDVQRLLGLASGTEKKAAEELKAEPAEEGKKGKKKEKKKKEKKKKDSGEKKEGFGKKLAALFFGSDDELEEEEAANAEGGQKSEDADAKKGAGAKDKKKKEKKKKEPKKKEPDPQKAAKEKQKKEKNAEKAKKKAEKAEQAEKEKRAAKKLPKKKVIVWVIFCASIGIGILLLNSVGMATVQLTDARDAFEEKDFETAYRLLNGRELSEEDQLIFSQSSAILHLEHVEETYGNHLKLEKPVKALNDLLTGVAAYQELLQAGRTELITPELTAEYQNILGLLQENYSLSEEGAMEINALESDYEYSLQLEALVNGEIYQSQAEVEQQEEEEALNLPDLEDMLPEEEEYFMEDVLPEEEEYFNDSSD